MNEKLLFVIDESIQLELNVSALYKIFHAAFPGDADFWWELLIEEENHAALIRSIKETFMPAGKFSDKMFLNSLEALKKHNLELCNLIKKYRYVIPSREGAFNTALEVELSACELHFQKFLDKKEKSHIEKIFEQLNRDDKDHVKRIRSYMETYGIDSVDPTFRLSGTP